MNYYVLGIVCGFLLALFGVILAGTKFRKAHPNTNRFDERQMVGRGKAFQAGFFTLLIAGFACNIWDYISPLPGSSFLCNICALLLGVAVFAVTAIHYDAYLSLFDNPRRFLLGGVLFIVAMGLSAITNLHGHRPFQRDIGILNLAVGLVWLVIVAALLLHRRETEEE